MLWFIVSQDKIVHDFVRSLKMRNKQNTLTTFLNSIQHNLGRKEGCLFALFVLALLAKAKEIGFRFIIEYNGSLMDFGH